VRLRFAAPGTCSVVGRRSPVALYDHDLATYDASDTFRHQDAEGFVRLWGLGVATWSARQGPGSAGARSGAAAGSAASATSDKGSGS
jgi:argininosuccinate synthase